jgi:hypothetical protein
MPVDMSRYPAQWKQISERIRFERARNRCEWCGVLNGAIGYRLDDGTFHQLARGKGDAGMEVEAAALDGEHIITIVLTVAHLGTQLPDGSPGDKHNKLDVRDENLAALCQRCHLLYDLDDHIANRRRTMARRKADTHKDAGQLAIWGE